MDLNSATARSTDSLIKLAPSWSHGSKSLNTAPYLLLICWLPRGAMDLNVDGGYKKNEWRRWLPRGAMDLNRQTVP